MESCVTYPPSLPKKRVLTNKKVDTSPSVSVSISVPDTSRWLTRNEAADLMSCSPNTLQNYETRGVLHPQQAYRKDRRGVEQRLTVYAPEELTALKVRLKRVSPREPSEIAARAFELFLDEKSLTEIVIELRALPETIEQLHEKWLDMKGARLVISPVVKEALEALVGPFESATDLVECVAKMKPAECPQTQA